jgi:release factor glutamine methyltransferase
LSSVRELAARGRDLLRGLPRTDPALESRLLLQKAAGLDEVRFWARPESAVALPARRAFLALVRRRRAGVPLAYLTGEREFWSLPFAVAPGVLIPRPETELLVEKALEFAPRGGSVIVEIGTGSGAVAVALAKELPRARVVAADVSRRALAVARENAARHGAAVTFAASNLFRGLTRLMPAEGADLIVSNPPYVAEAEWPGLPPEVRREPRKALVAGPTGLEFMSRLIAGAAPWLKPGGRLLFEVGRGQARRALGLFGPGWDEARAFKDLRGIRRVVAARKTGG